jgi:hypothetical protein
MKLICISFSILGVCLGVSSAAFGGTTRVAVGVHGGAYQYPGVQTSPGVIQVGDPMHCPAPGCSETYVSAGSQSLDLVVDGSASFQEAIATAHAAAHAEIGHLGIDIQAGGSGGAAKNQADATARASAEWLSGATFDVPGLFGGETYTVTSLLYLEGDMNGTANGENASMYGSFQIEDVTGLAGLPAPPYADGTWGSIHALNGGPELNEIPGVIRLTRQFRNGFSTAIGFRFSLFGLAQSDTVSAGPESALAGTAVVTADASHSLRWGGVESVIDAFGNPVTNWTLIGDNGFDFSKPFPVPEPTSVVSALVALSFLGSRRIGRR